VVIIQIIMVIIIVVVGEGGGGGVLLLLNYEAWSMNIGSYLGAPSIASHVSTTHHQFVIQ
jgi:acetyl-CoA carboxylase alpha subunit